MSFYEKMVDIAHEWAEQEGASAIDVDAAVDYALKHRLYQRRPPTQRELCTRDMRLSRLSWKWRKRSSVKIAERTYEKRAQALHC